MPPVLPPEVLIPLPVEEVLIPPPVDEALIPDPVVELPMDPVEPVELPMFVALMPDPAVTGLAVLPVLVAGLVELWVVPVVGLPVLVVGFVVAAVVEPWLAEVLAAVLAEPLEAAAAGVPLAPDVDDELVLEPLQPTIATIPAPTSAITTERIAFSSSRVGAINVTRGPKSIGVASSLKAFRPNQHPGSFRGHGTWWAMNRSRLSLKILSMVAALASGAAACSAPTPSGSTSVGTTSTTSGPPSSTSGTSAASTSTSSSTTGSVGSSSSSSSSSSSTSTSTSMTAGSSSASVASSSGTRGSSSGSGGSTGGFDAGTTEDGGSADGGVGDGGDAALSGWVNPFIGTEDLAPDYGLGNAGGNVFPGAVVPFGMVQLSPDTTSSAGGYRYLDSTIYGFSATHFSGRGVSCYQDVPVMPFVGAIGASPGSDWSPFGATFAHSTESASAGYYQVELGNGVNVELTATTRSGMLRLTYPASEQSTLLVNAGGSANGDYSGTGISLSGTHEISATAVSGNCGGSFTYTVYWVGEVDQAVTGSGVWNGSTATDGGQSAQGESSGAWLQFDTRRDRTVLLRFGLSWTSLAEARANLAAENPRWDFDAVRSKAAAAWNTRLDAIQVQGGTPDQLTTFYTALYHAQIHPSTFSDADGHYLGFDQAIHDATPRTHFHNFPGWDNYRSQMRLVPLIDAEAPDMMQSLVDDAVQDPGGGLPRWQHANANSGGMVGDSQDVVLATNYAFGVHDFDADAGLAAMIHGATDPQASSSGHVCREGLSDYLSLGYVSTDTGGSAALTLEYANDDFAIAQLAHQVGDTLDESTFLARSHSWRSLWNPDSGWEQGRDPDGGFDQPFDSTDVDDFVEGDAAQYVWLVPFDQAGLFKAMGGASTASTRLDDHTQQLNAGPGSPYLFMGNEPELEVPWEYDWAQRPWRTQELTRQILSQLYGPGPGDYPGNDDGGAMASWVVFAALGIYPEIPAVAGFALGSPLFPEARVHLRSGGTLRISAPLTSDANAYVQSVTVNGVTHPTPWVAWPSVERGGAIDVDLGPGPSRWGTGASELPPSFE